MHDPRTAEPWASKQQSRNSTRVLDERPSVSIIVGLAVGIVAAWFTPWSLAWLMYPAVALLVVVGVVLWIGGDA